MKTTKEFIPPHPLKTAVLFLIFNRLDTTKQVFEAIRKAKPPRLYIAADGPRKNKPGEDEKVRAVRKYVMNNIDWECEVKTLFRDKNLGCKYAVSSAITWFFENEEMGIILEDDCLPSQSFFWFCEELLERYKDDMRVWHISGNNFGFDKSGLKNTYSFIRFPQVWGWATWKNRWKEYDEDLADFQIDFNNNLDIKATLCLTNNEIKKMIERFFLSANNKIDTWDYQWHATVIKNNGLCIFPSCNLISNLGDGDDATHTKGDKERTHLNKYEINFPLTHVKNYFIDYELEKYIKKKMNISGQSIVYRILKK